MDAICLRKIRRCMSTMGRGPRKMSCVRYTALLVLVNFVLLSSLSVWLTPTHEEWLPSSLLNRSRKGGIFVQRFPSTRSNLNRTLRILLWTEWCGDPNWAEGDISRSFSSCPVSDCVVTKDKSDIVRADAVMFHAVDLWKDFLGYSLPDYRRPDQVWILQNHEPPTRVLINLKLYDNIFNWTSTYRSDSDIPLPYFKIIKLKEQKPSIGDIAATKSAGIAWVASNCGDDARRQMLVREINKFFPVDTYGDCGDRELPNSEAGIVLRKYKFYLSFENSYCKDYITEKFPTALQRFQIPIVAGGGNYKTMAPPHSYIDVKDFKSIKDLTDYLRYLDQNNTAYNSYFEWTRDYEVIMLYKRISCSLCEALHDGTRPAQVYTDMAGYIDDDTCQKWTISRFVYKMVQGYAMKFHLI